MELLCSPMRRLVNDSCQSIYTTVNGVVYIFNAYLYPVRGSEFKPTPFDIGLIYTQFSQQIDDILFLNYPWLFESIMICKEAVNENYKLICLDNSTCTKSDTLDYYEVEIRFQSTRWHDITETLSILSHLPLTGFNVTLNGSELTFEAVERDIGYTLPVSKGSYISYDQCSTGTEEITVTHQKSCPLVKLDLTEYVWQDELSGIRFPSLDVELSASDFHFGSNKSVLYICSDAYIDKFLNETDEDIHEAALNAEALLSLICVSVSLVCLFISFLTFCLFPRLRTLPGQTNMTLILCLFIAQTMFLVSSFSRFPRGSNACKTVGLLTHLFWLMSTFWMNICTFHVFKVFSNFGQVTAGKGLKTFLIYWFYSIMLSVTLVLVNIFVSLRNSNNTDFGYGAVSCYISSERMIGYTFGIPLGVVVVANLLMFLWTVCQLLRMPEIQKDVKNKRNDVIIFAKLSTLTGFTWIFGFIFSWTGVKVFSYFFIVLNASQGVFLFLSFVCNQRVLAMYKNRSLGLTSTSASYRSRNTESKSMANSQGTKC